MTVDDHHRHWLTLHDALSGRVRRGIVLLVVVTAVALIDGFADIQHDKERYIFAREFSKDLAKVGIPKKTVERLYQQLDSGQQLKRDRLSWPIVVPLQKIPEVRHEYELFLRRHHPDRALRIMNWELPVGAYVYAMLYAPLAILISMCIRLRAMAKIAAMLRPAATDGSETQRRLNSVFSDRVTLKLGENRRLYCTMWAVTLLVLCVTPQILLFTWQGGLTTETRVTIDAEGKVEPLQDIDRAKRVVPVRASRGMILHFLAYVLGSVVVVGFAVYYARAQVLPARTNVDPG